MKRIYVLALLWSIVICYVKAQETCDKTLEESLKDVSLLLQKDNGALWGKKLDANILFINMADNEMYLTSVSDGEVGNIEKTSWDNKVGLANTATTYNGEEYVTIIYSSFMPLSCVKRSSLLIHEIFHRHQNSLGLLSTASRNQHLDTAEGRALLHCEFGALILALSGNKEAIFEALCIRRHRQSLFPENNEDLFEINEGLAEYTGMKLSGMEDVSDRLVKDLKYNYERGYTNSFAYLTGPAYAFTLEGLYPEWRKDELLKNGLPAVYYKHTGMEKVNTELEKILLKYKFDEYLTIEKASAPDIASYETLLDDYIEKVFIPNNGVNIFFNPNDRVISLSDKAVLLKNVTLKGEWGEIVVNNGLVRMNDWSAFILLSPEMNLKKTEKPDYVLKLNQGWELVKKNGSVNYELTKTQ